MSFNGEIVPPSAPQPPVARGTGAATGKQILSASWQLLRADKSLLWLPILSAVSAVVAAVTLFLPTFFGLHAAGTTWQVGGYAGGALAAFAASSVAIFFQAALVIGAFERADGGDPTVGGVLAQAWAKKGAIFSWALVTTTVGLAIRAVEERLGWLGTILGFLGGLAWAIVSFLVIPVVVAEGLNPLAALKRASQLLRDTWGTSLRTTLRFGVIQVLALIALVVGVIAGVGLAAAGNGPARYLGLLLAAVCIVGFIALTIVFSAITTYARALIYRHAAGLSTQGVPDAVFAGAFVEKKKRR